MKYNIELNEEETQFLNEHNFVIVADDYIIVKDLDGGYYLAKIVKDEFEIELS